ncbi:MAG: hypothetical protein ABI467_31350 [Kofleriaceae bacterium]
MVARQRGLAGIGVELDSPMGIELLPVASGATVVRCSEARDGRPVGELEIEVFKAALVIDRDGILMEKVAHACTTQSGRATQPIAVSLPGASGFRASVELVRPVGQPQPALPFVYVFAIAPHDLGVDGGVLVTVRSASRAWPSADQILRSLKVIGRRPMTANDGPVLTLLPLAGDEP